MYVVKSTGETFCIDIISQILRISLYSESEDSCETSFGRRSTLHRGKVPLRDVIAAELEERLPKSRTALSGMPQVSIFRTMF